MSADLSAVYNGTSYWLEKINFDVTVRYNPHALKLLSTTTSLQADAAVTAVPGKMVFAFTNRDSVRAGKIAEMTFLAVVPDSVHSAISIAASNFRTDSLMFIDVIPLSNPAVFASTGECTMTTLRFTGIKPTLLQNRPNPFGEHTTIDFVVLETAPVSLVIYDVQGRPVKTLLNGLRTFEGGAYSVNVSAEDLETGVYTCVLTSGMFSGQMRMIVVK